jgi:hypothetical protein
MCETSMLSQNRASLECDEAPQFLTSVVPNVCCPSHISQRPSLSELQVSWTALVISDLKEKSVRALWLHYNSEEEQNVRYFEDGFLRERV